MSDLAWVVAVMAGFTLTGIGVLVFVERRDRQAKDRAVLELQRERARQEHDIRVMRELGRQMLGTLRPGEAPPVMEEDLNDRRTDDTWFYADDDGVVDPTDQLNPDPLLPDPIDPEATL